MCIYFEQIMCEFQFSNVMYFCKLDNPDQTPQHQEHIQISNTDDHLRHQEQIQISITSNHLRHQQPLRLWLWIFLLEKMGNWTLGRMIGGGWNSEKICWCPDGDDTFGDNPRFELK
ncbi:hypothetical protein L6452_19297 [Arctium lappa]|uniref:Uncharacterized protein n=1 Tax=Arctium lappa TaxID=4217 RepID=A0ACB9B9E9_ARCLA|nr:hypothetical protein L6452_19297 [Arctium lappa]